MPATRNAEPGPGRIAKDADSLAKVSIAGGKLVVAGGINDGSFSDPAYHWDNGAGGFSRGIAVQFDFTLTSQNGLVLGLAATTPVTLAQTKHALVFPDATFELPSLKCRDISNSMTGEISAMATELNATITFRLTVLADGGALLEAKGWLFGSDGLWRGVAYYRLGTDATLFPDFMVDDGAFTLDNLTVTPATTPQQYEAYYNGGFGAVGSYQIGRAISPDGTFLCRAVGNPVLSAGAGGQWDDDHVKDPWVLKDGATYRMWYSGHDGTNYRIGYAESSDGVTWTKSPSNPMIALGGASAFDESACAFPIVVKDINAPVAKRWRMIYSGKTVGGTWQLGYAFAANPNGPWTKGSSNPVVPFGGSADPAGCVAGAIVKSGSTYYLFYGGVVSGDVGQICLVTFTDFEGTYTKSSANPLLVPRTGAQALTANAAAGDTTLSVANSSVFRIGEPVVVASTTIEQNRISAIPNGTSVTLVAKLRNAHTTANSAKITTSYLSISPRSVVLENGTWKMLMVPTLGGDQGINHEETNSYATSSAPDSGWALNDTYTPLMWLSGMGENMGWEFKSTENIVWVLDADTGAREFLGPAAPSETRRRVPAVPSIPTVAGGL
jgi:predicted GH43/DUF377 family glycosyl hydrolase